MDVETRDRDRDKDEPPQRDGYIMESVEYKGRLCCCCCSCDSELGTGGGSWDSWLMGHRGALYQSWLCSDRMESNKSTESQEQQK